MNGDEHIAYTTKKAAQTFLREAVANDDLPQWYVAVYPVDEVIPNIESISAETFLRL